MSRDPNGPRFRQSLEQRESDGERPRFDVLRTDGVVLHGVRSGLPVPFRSLEECGRHIRAGDGFVDGKMLRDRIARQRVKFVEVSPDVRRRRAVVSLEKPVEERFHRLIRIPHPFGEKPGAEFGEVGVESPRVSLLKHILDVIVAEEFQIPLQGVEVGESVHIVAEIGGVIPQVEHIRLARPALDILHELDVARIPAHVQRLVEVAFDRTEAGHHIVAQARLFRRIARVLVGERLDNRIRILFLHLLRDGVHEPDDGTGVALLLFIDCCAGRALAVQPVVILAHAVQPRVGIGLDRLQHVGSDDPQDVRVRQARLRVPPARTVLRQLALPVAHRVVFGMILEIDLRRQQEIERVATAHALAETADRSAVPLLQGGAETVETQTCGEVSFRRVQPTRHPHPERGTLDVVETGRNRKSVQSGNNRMPGGEPADTAIRLQQFVCTVKATAHTTAHQQVGGTGGETETVIPKFFRPFQTDRRILRLRTDRKLHTDQLLHVPLQLLRRVSEGRTLIRHNDGVSRRFPTFRQYQLTFRFTESGTCAADDFRQQKFQSGFHAGYLTTFPISAQWVTTAASPSFAHVGVGFGNTTTDNFVLPPLQGFPKPT